MKTNSISKLGLTRRDFVKLLSIGSAGILVGCAVNPVSGRRQLSFISEMQEIDLDRKNAPFQFSADYGSIQDKRINNYVNSVGHKIAALSHRPDMPYSFNAVNANYLNAYAFPGGSIATTRGMLVSLSNESELAAVLGHEIGHVNARHTASRMTKGVVIGAVITGLLVYLGTENKKYVPIASGLGGIGSGILLAHYSRDDERQADELGMEYMSKAGYDPVGMTCMMDVLRGSSVEKRNIIELIFATHPMSEERYETTTELAKTKYKNINKRKFYKERFLDNTSSLRKIKKAIGYMQDGEMLIVKKNFSKAEEYFNSALKIAPDDYAGLLLMSKCKLAQEKFDEADSYAKAAQEVYPSEAQAYYISGVVNLKRENFEYAFREFDAYDKILPENPNIIFFKGYSLEKMQNIDEAAAYYSKYIKTVNSGEQAEYVRKRLNEWNRIKK